MLLYLLPPESRGYPWLLHYYLLYYTITFTVCMYVCWYNMNVCEFMRVRVYLRGLDTITSCNIQYVRDNCIHREYHRYDIIVFSVKVVFLIFYTELSVTFSTQNKRIMISNGRNSTRGCMEFYTSLTSVSSSLCITGIKRYKDFVCAGFIIRTFYYIYIIINIDLISRARKSCRSTRRALAQKQPIFTTHVTIYLNTF